MINTLSIIIPAYNEENTIQQVLSQISSIELIGNIKKEVIVINDCSTDRTLEKIEESIKMLPQLPVQIITQDKNRGKGAALHRGIEAANGEYLIIQDADLEYDPAEYNELLKPVIKVNADVVYGSRFIGSNPHRILFFWHSVGNKLLTFFSNIFTGLNLTDMETCYKLFRSSIIKGLDLKEKRFGFEPEVTAKVARIAHIKIYEIGISYYGRTYEEGKKINAKDGFRAIWCILKYRFKK